MTTPTARPVIDVPHPRDFVPPRPLKEILRETFEMAQVDNGLRLLAGMSPLPEKKKLTDKQRDALRRANEKRRADAEAKRRALGQPTNRTPSGFITRAKYTPETRKARRARALNNRRDPLHDITSTDVEEKAPRPTLSKEERSSRRAKAVATRKPMKPRVVEVVEVAREASIPPEVCEASTSYIPEETGGEVEVVMYTEEEVEAIPEEVDATPEEVDATPEEVEAIPEEVDATPEEVEATPEEVEEVENRGRGRPPLIDDYLFFPKVVYAEKEIEEGDMMIAKQYAFKHKDGHEYMSFRFSPIPAAVILGIVLQKCNIHLFEQILVDDPRKGYFDVDSYKPAVDHHALDEIKEIIFKHFGDQPLAVSGSVKWVSEKEMFKHSYHIVMWKTKYENHAHMKECLYEFARLYRDQGFDDRAYASRQNMKLPWQSKAGSDRVQEILECDEAKHHFITQFFVESPTAPKAMNLPVPVPEIEPDPEHTPSNIVTTSIPEGEESDYSHLLGPDTIRNLVALLHPKRAEGRDTWIAVGQVLKGAGDYLSLFIEFSKRSPDKSKIPTDDEIARQWETLGRGSGRKLKLASLFFWARNDNPRGFEALGLAFEKKKDLEKEFRDYHGVKIDVKADYKKATLEEGFGLEEARFRIPHFVNHIKVDVWGIGMGRGKTENLLRIVREKPGRYLIVTCRRSLVDDIAGRFGEAGIPIGVYSKFTKAEKSTKMLQCDNLIINGESLAYIRNVPKPYDHVFIDEFESFTDTWTSHETHKALGLRSNWEGFMDAWVRAKHICLLDAFITKKTTAFLEEMGDTYRVIGSDYPPPKRSMRFFDFPERTSDRKKVAEAMKRIVDDLKAGKNLLVFYPRSAEMKQTGLPDIESFSEVIREEAGVRKDETFVYYGDQDEEIKDTLKDTNRVWTKSRLVVCNSCVTVGVSFTRQHFDKQFIFIPSFLTSRALTQFTYRARNLKENLVDVCFLSTYKKPPADRALFAGMMEGCAKRDAFGVLEDFAEREKQMAGRDHMAYFSTLAGYEISAIEVDKVDSLEWMKERLADVSHTEAEEYGLKQLLSEECAEMVKKNKRDIYEIKATRAQKATMKKFYYASLFQWEADQVDEEFLERIWSAGWEKYVRAVHSYLNPTPNTLFPYKEVLLEERRVELEKVALGELEHEKIAVFTKEEQELYGKKLGIKLFLGKRQNTTQLANELLKRMFGLPLLKYKKSTRKYEFQEVFSGYLKKIIENLTVT